MHFPFWLCFTLYFRAIFQVHAPGELIYLEGRFNGEFFVLPVWGAYNWSGLYMKGLIYAILWATTPSFVGCYMLCPSADAVACCCVLLGVVRQSFETGQTFSYVQTDATTPNMVGSATLGSICCGFKPYDGHGLEERVENKGI